MLNCSPIWLLSLAILLLGFNFEASEARVRDEKGVKSGVFLSPKLVLHPGSVSNKNYLDIDFPRGHIAIKEFNAELVDEMGNSVPLHETYLHHWLVVRYYGHKDVRRQSENMEVRNSGTCQDYVLGQYFGLGSETRRTDTIIPDPYGIEIGNSAEIPEGYEERWMLNVHAIDTRGVVDRLGCTECRCDLYNITNDQAGQPLGPNYAGGLKCCYDQTRCMLREGFKNAKRSLYLRYTVKWVDWRASVVPVKIYIFDASDTREMTNDTRRISGANGCKIEYDVESCSATGMADNGCTDTKKISFVMPTGGYVIYGVAHQHTGGIGGALYREDGRCICSSTPVYGRSKKAGDEAGYIVGMSTCYPQPGTVKISDGEILIFESNYNSTQKHTGVMGLFYILVADSTSKPLN